MGHVVTESMMRFDLMLYCGFVGTLGTNQCQKSEMLPNDMELTLNT